jgi:hypothetical protein
MSMEIFPASPKPSYNYIYNEEFSTILSQFGGENEQRESGSIFPTRSIIVIYKTLNPSDRTIIRNFFRKRRGGLESFWYFDFFKDNWIDEYVGRGGPFFIDGAFADDGGSITDETIYAREATADDMTLLPAVPAENDAYYFGSKIKFDKLSIYISTQGAGTWTIVWEYWNGSSWVALSDVTDGTSGFKAVAGEHDVTFTMPSDFSDCQISNSENLYFIRARVSSYTSITTQPKGSYAKVNTKTYDLPSKSTDNDSSLILYVNNVVTDKSFISGGGGGGADRIAFADYQATGSLITADFGGYLRIKACLPDSYGDSRFGPQNLDINQIKLRESR